MSYKKNSVSEGKWTFNWKFLKKGKKRRIKYLTPSILVTQTVKVIQQCKKILYSFEQLPRRSGALFWIMLWGFWFSQTARSRIDSSEINFTESPWPRSRVWLQRHRWYPITRLKATDKNFAIKYFKNIPAGLFHWNYIYSDASLHFNLILLSTRQYLQ